MKSLMKGFFLLSFSLVTAGMFTNSYAQRGDKGHGSERSNGGSGGGRNEGFSAPSRSFSSGMRSSVSNNRSQYADRNVSSGNRSFSQRPSSARSVDNYNSPRVLNRSTTVNRSTVVNRPTTVNRSTTVVTTTSGVHRFTPVNNVSARPYRPYGYNTYTGYRGYGVRNYVIIGGPRYKIIPHNYLSIRYGGYPYYYNRGLFYYNIDGYYQSIFPPFGIRINALPYGYYPFYLGPDPYYYYNGIYYRRYDDTNYEVVDAPMGATVPSLPKGSKSVMVNGEKFYELNGTYYQEGTNKKGEVVYTVVGKNGQINNSAGEGDNANAPLKQGDIISQLPDGCKKITINGEQLYVSPDDTYFKEEKDGENTDYKVVGGNSL